MKKQGGMPNNFEFCLQASTEVILNQLLYNSAYTYQVTLISIIKDHDSPY